MSPTSGAGVLPNFIVIGAAKSGTTSLFHYLAGHPQVFMSSVKELDFFVAELNWSKGVEWYERQFRHARDAVAVGEASTNYTFYPRYAGVPARIAGCVPSARLVYVVRDPIQRIRSQYEHRRMIGRETERLETVVLNKPVYLDRSRYAMQLEQYLEHFPREQILVITAEDLRDQRVATVAHVYGFLGVDTDFMPPVIGKEFYRTQERRTHSSFAYRVRATLKRKIPAAKRAKELFDRSWSSPVRRRTDSAASGGLAPSEHVVMPDAVRQQLAEALRDDVARLRAYLPPGFDGWGIG